MVYLLFLIGFSLLFFGGKYLVEGSVSFAKGIGVSPLIIGIVLVGFGTSVPELMTCMKANLMGASDIAISNVIGSNIANILLVLGIGALITFIPVDKKEFKRDYSVLFISAILLTLLCFWGYVNRYVGLAFIFALISYSIYCYKTGSLSPEQLEEELQEESLPFKNPWLSFGIAAFGILAVILGANFLIDSSIQIAKDLGVSEVYIGLTAVAIGTSLPELATIIVAQLKRHSDLALGNIIGSNIFNTLGILGTTAAVKNIDISKQVLKFDIWIMNLAVLLLMLFVVFKGKISRLQGSLLLSIYILYIVAISFRG